MSQRSVALISLSAADADGRFGSFQKGKANQLVCWPARWRSTCPWRPSPSIIMLVCSDPVSLVFAFRDGPPDRMSERLLIIASYVIKLALD